MKHFEDKRCCPNCGHELHEQPYLMARRATENVLSWTQIGWILIAILALALLAQAAGS